MFTLSKQVERVNAALRHTENTHLKLLLGVISRGINLNEDPF